MKRTYQRKSQLTRARTHGFRNRSSKVLQNRRKKGRKVLATAGGTKK